jgi:SAM-dependent methyltransferase
MEPLSCKDASAVRAGAPEELPGAATDVGENAGALPDRLNQLMRGFMPSRCILTALELDLFTAIGDGASAEVIAAKIHTDARATAMLLNALVALQLLTKQDDVYRNMPEPARFFVQGSQENQREGLLHTANIWHRWSTLTDAVRSGTCIPIDRSGAPEWTVNFIAGMQQNSLHRAPQVVKALGTAGVRSILDLGGGSGIYSVAFAQACPDLHSEILDLPAVVPLTNDYIAKAGVAAQVSIRAGDMLRDDFGTGYDLILLNAICHMFSAEQNLEIFRRARRALAPNGRLAVQDFILDSDKTGPLQAVLFSLNMLVGTEAGASYSASEYAAWMKTAGFAGVRQINLAGPSDLIVGLVT